MKNKFSVVIVAAGSGSRIGGDIPKQFLPIGGIPMLMHTLKAFEIDSVSEIILVVSEAEKDNLSQYGIDVEGLLVPVIITCGGKERFDSVYAGVSLAKGEYVLIQDGARPFVSRELINRCMETVEKYDACVAAVPVTDTIKSIKNQDEIDKTFDRSILWAMQTPQAFKTSLIMEAYRKTMLLDSSDSRSITDDAMVVEKMMGTPVHIVKGEDYNIKVTTEYDLYIASLMAEKYLKKSFPDTE